MFGKLTRADVNLATAAKPAATANAGDVYAKLSRGIQERRAGGKPATFPGGCKDHQITGSVHTVSSGVMFRVAVRCRRLPVRRPLPASLPAAG